MVVRLRHIVLDSPSLTFTHLLFIPLNNSTTLDQLRGLHHGVSQLSAAQCVAPPQLTLNPLTTPTVKELSDIRTKGTPAGIALLSADTMSEWVFTIAVLGDDTVYKVRYTLNTRPDSPGRTVRAPHPLRRAVPHRVPRGDLLDGGRVPATAAPACVLEWPCLCFDLG